MSTKLAELFTPAARGELRWQNKTPSRMAAYALKLRSIWGSLSYVVYFLRETNQAEISFSIVEPIMIYVVNPECSRGVQDEPGHKKKLSITRTFGDVDGDLDGPTPPPFCSYALMHY